MHENATSHKVQLRLRRMQFCRIRYLEEVIMSPTLQPHQYESRNLRDGFVISSLAQLGKSMIEIASDPCSGETRTYSRLKSMLSFRPAVKSSCWTARENQL